MKFYFLFFILFAFCIDAKTQGLKIVDCLTDSLILNKKQRGLSVCSISNESYGNNCDNNCIVTTSICGKIRVPLNVVIFKKEDGTNPLSISIFNSLLTDINANYSNSGIEFFIQNNNGSARIRYEDDSDFYDECSLSNSVLIQGLSYYQGGCVNILINYCSSTSNGSAVAIGGNGPLEQIIYIRPLVDQSFIGGLSPNQYNVELISHELAHVLGLYHTHEVDFGDGSNCDEGDLILDTPEDIEPTYSDIDMDGDLDPLTYNLNNCTYTGNMGIQPLTSNIIGYYRGCRNSFTSCQTKKMNDVLSSCKEVLCSSPEAPRINVFEGSAAYALPSSNSLTLAWPCAAITSARATLIGANRTNTGNCVDWVLTRPNGTVINISQQSELTSMQLSNFFTGPGTYTISARDRARYNSNCFSPAFVVTVRYTETCFDNCQNGTETCVDGGGNCVNSCNSGCPPTFATASSDITICSGKTAILEAGGGVSYVWGPSAGLNSTTSRIVNASPTTTTTYYVTVTNSSGCTDVADVKVTVLPSTNSICNCSGLKFVKVEVIPANTNQFNIRVTFSGNPSGTYDIFDDNSTTSNFNSFPPGEYTFGPYNSSDPTVVITIEDESNPSVCNISQSVYYNQNNQNHSILVTFPPLNVSTCVQSGEDLVPISWTNNANFNVNVEVCPVMQTSSNPCKLIYFNYPALAGSNTIYWYVDPIVYNFVPFSGSYRIKVYETPPAPRSEDRVVGWGENFIMSTDCSTMGANDCVGHAHPGSGCETCIDGIQNGDETGVDCGGNNPNCPPCSTVSLSLSSTTCESLDEELPVFLNCPTTPYHFGNDPDVCGAYVNWSIPVATDNCLLDTINQTAGPISGSNLPVGVYPITYTAIDTAGNSALCSFIVFIDDTQLPVINCPQNITVSNDNGTCQATVLNIEPEFAQDNCDYDVFWVSTPDVNDIGISVPNDASGAVFPVGMNQVTYSIQELNSPNNTVSCSFTIVVEDLELPTVGLCPSDIVVSNEPKMCGAVVLYDTPTFNDNCDGFGNEGSLSLGLYSGDFFPTGTTPVLWQYTDMAGNGPVSCSFSVTVLDNEPPTIFCDSLVVCNEYSYQPDREIWPSDTITARIQVKNDLNITDLNITQLTGTHLSMGDLTATLVSPAGTSVVLFGGLCAGTTDFNITLDDEAAAGAIPCAPLGNGGVWRPQNPLDAFDDESALGEWKLILTNAFGGPCGTLTNWQMRICGNNNETGANVLSVVAETDRCDWKANGTLLDPPFYDNCPDSIITHNLAMAPDMHTLNGTVFPVGQTPITWTATDASGNTTTCNIIVEVLDTQAPKFLNCPEPNVIQPAEPGICGAYVNFAQPIAVDNCMPMPVVTKTDATGLNSSSVFPVGTTIMNWLATDAHGNTAQCSVKVIVNDTQAPTLACPADLTVNTDVWQCDAVVNGIAPASFDDNCDNNLSLVYQIRFPAATDTVIAAGVWNASGEIFPKGMATVDYRVADQPLLLITEVAQSIDTVNGGMMPVPPSFDVVNGDDYLEVTNFGPAALDVSCLNIERLGGPAGEQITLPAGTTMQPGQVLTIHFGNGEDNPAGLFFNVKCAADFATFKPSAYVVSYKGVVKDVAALNGFNPAGQGTLATVPAATWSGTTGNVGNKGGIYRKFIYDNNKAFDFALADVCHPLTIGTLNPDLDVFPANGSTTALQSIAPNEKSCSFKVTVQDKEKPSCGEWEQHDYTAATNLGTPNSITGGKVLKSVINVPQNFKVGDIDLLNVNGTHPNTDDLIFKLTSPEGTQAILFGGLCDGQPNFNLSILSDTVPSVTTAGCAPLGQGGQFTPVNGALFKFFGQNSQGNWTLEIADSVGINNGQLNGWTLRLQEIQPYSQMDTTFENDLGECGALFTWRNARFIDNCRVGTLELKYVTQDGINVPPTPGLINGGEVHTEFFEVGTTTVRYILRDVSGNVDSCEFDVTILDTERPVVVCPADITVQLDGGECRRAVFYAPASATDNCAVVDTLMTPPSGTIFEIGTHTVSIVIFDPAGNTDTCFFKVNILEHIPTSGGMVCNDLSHVSLDSTCVYKLDADAALEGDDYHCYEDYIITLTNSLGQNVGNTFTGAHVGQTFTVTVVDPETGNSCWGTLKLEDKLSPTITCPPNITILCTEDEDNLTLTGVPQWEDCSAVTTFHTDQYTQYDCAANQLVTASFLRKWTARDVWGNLSTCYQTISQLRGDLAQVVFPTNIDLPCTAVPNDLSPDISGWPKIGNINLTTTSTGFCGLGVSYLDEVTHICPGTYKTIRTWKVIDWCTIDGNPITQIHVQYIKVNDQPPVVNLTNFEYDSLNQCYKLGVNNIVNGECVATGNLPVAVIDGVCNSIVELEISTPWGLVQNGGIIPDPGLSIGQYPISYTVRDACGNFMQKDIQVCVADYTPPLPVCDEWTQVALGLNGTAFVNASDLDDGSYDNCAPVHFKARRMDANACQTDTVFHDQVKFCCTDINDTINVILRVYDVDPGAGVVAIGAFEGHYNDCMVQVLVEDKIKPICTAPANVTVTCELFDPSLWAYGTATGTDNCCVDTIIGTVNYSQFDSLCNRGTITRNWTVKDCAANTANCSQKVIVQYNQEYYVKFPADKVISVCDGTGSYGAPTFFGEDCELLATSFVDEVFTVVPDACFKIERTWTVINWCTYSPNAPCIYVPNPDMTNGPTVSAPGNNIANWAPTSTAVNGVSTNYGTIWSANANCYQYKQIIKIIDTADPVVVTPSGSEYCDYSANDANYWNADYWWDNAIQSHNLCEGEADIAITGIDSCSGANISFRYLLFLDLDGNGSMETVVPGSPLPQVYNEVRFDNVNTVGYAGGDPRAFDHRAVAPTQKWGWGLTTDTIGGARIAHVRWVNQQGQNAVPQLPLGTHKIKWTIEDGCGNEVSSETTFTVKDCKKPTVVCVNGLSINQMNGPANTVTLWASDFLQYGDDNCTPSPLLKYGIRKSGTGSGFPTVNGTAQTSVTFDCSELGTQLVELWAEDKAGNADFCETYVLIQDNMGVCTQPGMASIAGALKTEAIQGVEDANVELDGSSNGTPMLSDVFSNISGNYVFSNALPITANATITPTLDADPLNGVNTWDLVLISRHILGLEPLNSPYKLIAADANKSGTVTTFDIVELRKLILGTYTVLPNNESWRFIDKAQIFTNNENPFADVIRENLQIANIQSSITDGDFIGAKIGDVDGTATPNNLVSSDERTAGILLFDVTDRKVKAGETFTVNFKAAQAVKGYQFTLNFSGLEVVDVVPGTDMTTENFGVFADAITTSADATEGEFAVTFRAKTAGQLSNMLGVSSRITKAVAFTSAALTSTTLGAGDGNNKLDVAFRFNNGGTSTIAGLGFELYQNIPNPWVNKTTISFYLPDTAKARLSIFDETGRLLFTTQEHYNKGYNSIQLDRSMLPSTGTLYYTLDTDTNTATRKMLEMK